MSTYSLDFCALDEILGSTSKGAYMCVWGAEFWDKFQILLLK